MSIAEMVRQLPEDLKRVVADYLEFLLKKRSRKHGVKLLQNWAGALRDYTSQHTSLELQKKINEWRGD